MPACGPSQGATSLAEVERRRAGRLQHCEQAARRGRRWWVSAAPAAARRSSARRSGRTTAPAYSGAEAGTTPAGSAAVPGACEEPQPASARDRGQRRQRAGQDARARRARGARAALGVGVAAGRPSRACSRQLGRQAHRRRSYAAARRRRASGSRLQARSQIGALQRVLQLAAPSPAVCAGAAMRPCLRAFHGDSGCWGR